MDIASPALARWLAQASSRAAASHARRQGRGGQHGCRARGNAASQSRTKFVSGMRRCGASGSHPAWPVARCLTMLEGRAASREFRSV